MRLQALVDIIPRFRNKLHRFWKGVPEFNKKLGASDSEITFYLKYLRNTLCDESLLANFRRPYNYREILEHVDHKLGAKYLNIIDGALGDRAYEVVRMNMANDLFGNPVKYRYGDLGEISPTTLRYIATALDIEREIGIGSPDSIAEIGVGYGGQAAVIRRMFKIEDYTFFDLPEVLELSSRYLRAINLDLKMRSGALTKTLRSFDLVISNYAFSELARDLQENYLEKVLLKSTRGYMIMNSGRKNTTGRSEGKMKMEELLNVLPNSRVKEEIPLTGPDNYVLLWG